MSSQARNLAAGLLASALSVVAAVVAVPFYVRLLGSEGYGLVALFVTLQGVLQLFDSGLTTAIAREVARAGEGAASEDVSEIASKLVVLAWTVAGVIAVALLTAAPLLGHQWLRLDELTPAEATAPLLLMALAIGLRWPIGVYQHVLIGADRLARVSTINVAMTLATHSGAVALLVMAGGGLKAFFAWQVAASVLQVTWTRWAAGQVVALREWRPPTFRVPHGLVGFSTTTTLVAAVGLILTYLDKLMLSRLLPLGAFGEYMLASMVAGTLYVLVTPMFQWAYPRLSKAAAGDMQQLRNSYRIISLGTASGLLPLAILFIVGGEAVLTLWLGDRQAAARIAPVLAMLAAGSALHGIMFITYALTLARGASAIALRINVALLVAFTPALLLMAVRYGSMGAAAAWLVLHLCNLVLGGWFTHRILLPGLQGTWLRDDVGPALLTTLLLGGAGYLAVAGPLRGLPMIASLALAMFLSVGACLVLVMCSRRLRSMGRVILKSAV